ncbi:MAG: glycosyltransferase [Thermomicrobia bacterium]|nr:glycosyltransferase [Thermomicrobia bacterium]
MEPLRLPTVSVVIPAYNEARVIARCLGSLLDQTHRPCEIIVVDDGSTDGTQAIARGFGGVTLLEQSHAGSGAARNRGAGVATGDVLCFLDADMRFARDFLTCLVAPIARGEATGTFHTTEYVANPQERWARLWNSNQRLPITRKLPDDYPDRQAVFRAVRRDAFHAAGGFRAGGYDDDLSLAARLGTLAVAAPGAVCYHTNPARLREVYGQARWIGASNAVPQTMHEFWRYCPLNPRGKGWRALLRPGERALPLFRLVYGAGICTGMLRARRGRNAK